MGLNFRERREKFFERLKKEKVLRWMTSFVVTTTVATTVVVATQKADVEATFNIAEVLDNKVYYETEIIDPDDTLIENSLVLDVKSGLETFSFPLNLGLTSGEFDIRYYDMDYELAIRGSQGYGKKTFASKKVRSSKTATATILRQDYSNENGRALNFSFEILVSDPGNALSNITLYPYFVFEKGQNSPSIEPNPLPEVALTPGFNYVTVESVPSYASYLLISISGTKNNEEVILLEEKLDLPPDFYASVNVLDFTSNSLTLMTDVFSESLYESTATLNLYEEDALIASREFNVPLESIDGTLNPPIFTFNDLKTETIYSAQIEIPFFDTIRKSEEKYFSEMFTLFTAPLYSYTLTPNIGERFAEFTLEMVDEQNVIANVIAECYTLDENGEKVYVTTTSFEYIDDQTRSPYFSAFIDIITDDIKVIEISINKEYQNQYASELIETFTI